MSQSLHYPFKAKSFTNQSCECYWLYRCFWLQEYPIHLIAVKDPRLVPFLTEWEVFDALYNEVYSSRLVYLWREVCPRILNSPLAGLSGRHFTGDIFRCIFVNENFFILIKFSLKFVSKGPINNIPALVQIMAWRRSGDKPLSEPMLT